MYNFFLKILKNFYLDFVAKFLLQGTGKAGLDFYEFGSQGKG